MVYAIPAVWIESPSRLALTLEPSLGVSTEALLAQAQVLETFIDVNTLTLFRIESEAMRTCAKEGSWEVSASSWRLAQRGAALVLVLTIPPVAC